MSFGNGNGNGAPHSVGCVEDCRIGTFARLVREIRLTAIAFEISRGSWI